MKKGINFWSFAAGTTVETAIAIAKDAGFDGIELAMDHEGLAGLNTADAAIKAKELAEKAGIAVPSLASSIGWDYLLTSTLPEKRQQAKNNIKRQLDMAAVMGCDTILALAGAVGVDFLPGGGENLMDYDDAYDTALEAFRELAKYAQEVKVTIAIENVWNKFLLSPLEMRDFIDKIGSPYVGCYFDVGNAIQTGYPEQWIKILGSRIKKVHFKDYRRDPGGFNCFCDLLSGDVNWPAVTAALQKAGYNDYCTAEMIPGYTFYPEQMIYNTAASVTRILKGTQ
ncbi:MAG: sugar phosphate isomerase/epimerase family protein [Oscillospiraceae bacterium]